MPKKQEKSLFEGCVLLKQRSDDGLYINFFVCWYHKDKFYRLRVKPCFLNDLKLLQSHSILVPPGEPLEKYF